MEKLALERSYTVGSDTSLIRTLTVELGASGISQLYGVPVVASRTGGIPEIVDDSRTGLLAQPGSAEDFAAKTRKLLTDTELAGRMGQCGRESVRSRFTSEKMVSAVEDLYVAEGRQARDV